MSPMHVQAHICLPHIQRSGARTGLGSGHETHMERRGKEETRREKRRRRERRGKESIRENREERRTDIVEEKHCRCSFPRNRKGAESRDRERKMARQREGEKRRERVYRHIDVFMQRDGKIVCISFQLYLESFPFPNYAEALINN